MNHGIELWGSRYRSAVELAREFRKRPTHSEALLWQALRARRLCGLKFRRQHPTGPFILDFYCPERRLAIEVDGPVHDDHAAKDAVRQALIEEAKICFVRLTADEVERDMQGCLLKILRAAEDARDRTQ